MNNLILNSLLALTTDHSLTVYVDKLKRVYQTPPTTWFSRKHIKLAMTNENGTQHTREPDELIEQGVKGDVGSLMASNYVPVYVEVTWAHLSWYIALVYLRHPAVHFAGMHGVDFTTTSLLS